MRAPSASCWWGFPPVVCPACWQQIPLAWSAWWHWTPSIDGCRTRSESLGIGCSQANSNTETWIIRAPASSCNAHSVAAPWGSALPALWRDDVMAGASHCDFEAPTDWICRLACGAADASRQLQVRQSLLAGSGQMAAVIHSPSEQTRLFLAGCCAACVKGKHGCCAFEIPVLA